MFFRFFFTCRLHTKCCIEFSKMYSPCWLSVLYTVVCVNPNLLIDPSPSTPFPFGDHKFTFCLWVPFCFLNNFGNRTYLDLDCQESPKTLLYIYIYQFESANPKLNKLICILFFRFPHDINQLALYDKTLLYQSISWYVWYHMMFIFLCLIYLVW